MGMTRDEIIEGFEKEIRRIHREPKEKMLGIFMTVDEAEDIVALLKEQEAKEQCLKTKCIICPHCDHCDVDENGLLKEQNNEYENGFNDAMLGKQELMYEGTDGKWHKKDW